MRATLQKRGLLAETINGLYKAELIHKRGPWKTKADAELATLE
ncbi:Transposase [Mycetohabitans rhizoxinica HKI 454]|uniref:Transposase n=2 Tax=Mycetohabitans TaxID=2571159 RepID=E5AQD9_MYCRK|nr:putative transposase [Mycetohabitans sp.]CBW74821.1 Transposase [Mycetohabitans rhizoxinica HKI 454]